MNTFIIDNKLFYKHNNSIFVLSTAAWAPKFIQHELKVNMIIVTN